MMWRIAIQPASVKFSRWVHVKFRARPPRRRRRLFVSAENLEPRTVLSADPANLAGPFIGAFEPQHNLPSGTADSAAIAATNASTMNQSLAAMDAVHNAVDASFGSERMSLDFNPLASLVSSSVSAFVPPSSPMERFSGLRADAFDHHFEPNPTHAVEARFAETGQVISLGAAGSVRDDSGLTVSDGSGPTAYVRTTDTDGRIQSRLVFITRTTRSESGNEPTSPMPSQDVIFAEAELSADSAPSEEFARADLHDLTTVLDSAQDKPASPTHNANEPTMLAANSRVRQISMRSWSASQRLIPVAGDASAAKESNHKQSWVRMTDGHDAEQDESLSFAWPAFDPTTRNLVLSICLLGSFARAAARYRRRQRAAMTTA